MKAIRVYLVVVGAALGFVLMMFLSDPWWPSSQAEPPPVEERYAFVPAPVPDTRSEPTRPADLVNHANETNDPRPIKVTNYAVIAAPAYAQQDGEKQKGQKALTPATVRREEKSLGGTPVERADAALSQGRVAEALSAYNLALDHNPKDAKIFSLRAWAQARLDRPEMALADCSKALELEPNVALHWENRGVFYFGRRQCSEAIADFDQAIARDPGKASTYIHRALAHWALGNKAMAQADFVAADRFERTPEYNPLSWQGGLPPVPATRTLEEWNRQIQLNPKDDQAYFGRGTMRFLSLSKLADAFEDFCKAIDLNPKVANYFHARGRVFLLWQNQYEAIRDFDKAMELGLNTAQIHNIRAVALMLIGKDQEADAAFIAARKLEARPASDTASIQVGTPIGAPVTTADARFPSMPAWLPAQTGSERSKTSSTGSRPAESASPSPWHPYQVAEPKGSSPPSDKAPSSSGALARAPLVAGRSANRTAEPSSTSVDAGTSSHAASHAHHHKRQGRTALDAKLYAVAIDALTRAIELDPNDYEACDLRGQAYLRKGDYDNAQKDFSTAVWLDPKNADYHAHRGLAHYYRKQVKESLADFQAASTIEPSNPAHFNYMGIAHLELNDVPEALGDFAKAIALNQSDAQAWNNRASALRKLNRFVDAINDYNKAIEINPNVAAFWVNRGSVHCLQAKYKDALADFDRAIEIDPTIAEAYAGRAWSYQELGMSHVAEKDWEQTARLKSPTLR